MTTIYQFDIWQSTHSSETVRTLAGHITNAPSKNRIIHTMNFLDYASGNAWAYTVIDALYKNALDNVDYYSEYTRI